MKTSPVRIPPIDVAMLDRLDFKVSDLMKPGLPGGHPLEIPIGMVVENPEQPRSEDNPGFSAESLQELADSIVESGGLKTPISVRSMKDGVYVINHGARRLRASKLAGMEKIKGFVDDLHDEYDQAIENIQREDLTPMEIAEFIGRREKKGRHPCGHRQADRSNCRIHHEACGTANAQTSASRRSTTPSAVGMLTPCMNSPPLTRSIRQRSMRFWSRHRKSLKPVSASSGLCPGIRRKCRPCQQVVRRLKQKPSTACKASPRRRTSRSRPESPTSWSATRASCFGFALRSSAAARRRGLDRRPQDRRRKGGQALRADPRFDR